MKVLQKDYSRGFTVIELIISATIFAFMTALVVSRVGNFNQETALTNVAYDMALTIHSAQTFGISTISLSNSTPDFNATYGINFDMNRANQFQLFTDPSHAAYHSQLAAGHEDDDNEPNEAEADDDGHHHPQHVPITTYSLKQGITIKDICIMDNRICNHDESATHPWAVGFHYSNQHWKVQGIDVTFTRPDPDAYIQKDIHNDDDGNEYWGGPYKEIRIVLQGTGGAERVISIRKNAQVSVMN